MAIDLTMTPAWERTTPTTRTLYYQALPMIQYQTYVKGVTDGSGESTGWRSAKIGMAPLDTTGYQTAHVSLYNIMDTIGYAKMDSGYSSGISVGDFLWMRSTGRTARRDLVRVLKVITDGEDGGSSHPTAETILILELQLDAMGWPNPDYNGFGSLTTGPNGGRGFRFDFTAWGHSGTVELVTENLASGGTSYSVERIGDGLPIEDTAGMGLGAAYSANEKLYWNRTGFGSGRDVTPYVMSAHPTVIHDHGGTSPIADVDRDGHQGVTADLDQPGYHRSATGYWSVNFEQGYGRTAWGSGIYEARRLGQSTIPYIHSGDSVVKDVDGNEVIWYGRHATPISGHIENLPPEMVISWQSGASTNYAKASRAFYHLTFSGQPSDGDTVTITDDSSNSKVFEFESGGGVTGSNVSVAIDASHAAATAINLNTAIRAQSNDSSFKVYSDADADFYGGSSATTGDDKVVKVLSTFTGSTTNFAVAESASNVTATKKFSGHDGGGYRPINVISGAPATVPGGYNIVPIHCCDMIVTLKR